LDLWCFDVFALNRATDEHSLRTIVYELFTRHNLHSRFKIPPVFLTTLLDALEGGYGKYRNPYHNQVHAADVTQTVHCFLLRTGVLVRPGWSAARCPETSSTSRPSEGTGGTAWHGMAWGTLHGCGLAWMAWHGAGGRAQCGTARVAPRGAGDTAWHGMGGTARLPGCGDVVLGGQTSPLRPPARIDKSKVLSLLLHAADISHPTKQWSVHSRWTKALMEEFFRQVGPSRPWGGGVRGHPLGTRPLPCQGDKEAELGLPFSPLCDRTSTLVAQSQIGFIDFIVEPTFSVLTDVAEKMVMPAAEDGTKAKGTPAAQQASCPRAPSPQWRQPSLDEHLELGDIKANLAGFRSTWTKYIQENKQKWKERAASGITNQASIEELSPCEEPAAPARHRENGDVE
ncbi:PDE1B phosphodiesterase, partial [Centropus unirufus]|nr:PDE1B phosphodiesterase [Centropus unirufus]